MEMSHYWEANSCSGGEEITNLVYNLRFITVFTRAHSTSNYFLKLPKIK
jgi:hypothetical protein